MKKQRNTRKELEVKKKKKKENWKHINNFFLNSGVFSSKMEKTEDKISKEKDRSIKPTQSDQKGEDRPRKNELRLIDLESIKKKIKFILYSLRRWGEKLWTEKVSKEIMDENFSSGKLPKPTDSKNWIKFQIGEPKKNSHKVTA